jgi:hypothetical protein
LCAAALIRALGFNSPEKFIALSDETPVFWLNMRIITVKSFIYRLKISIYQLKKSVFLTSKAMSRAEISTSLTVE